MRDYLHSEAPIQIRGILRSYETHFTPPTDGKLNYDGGADIIDRINQSIWSEKKGGERRILMTLAAAPEKAWNAH